MIVDTKTTDICMNPICKPKFTEKDLGLNPLVNNLSIPTVNFANGQYKMDSEGIMLPSQIELEYTPYTKLYKTAAHRSFSNNLSDKSQRLYLWLLYEVECGKDYMWINKERYMKENNIKSMTTYINAYKELIRYTFIASTAVKDIYWINPELFFCGNRIEKFRKHVYVKYDTE